jgi:hypothetical protein
VGARDNLNANLLSLPGTGAHFLSHPPCSIITILTELFWFWMKFSTTIMGTVLSLSLYVIPN